MVPIIILICFPRIKVYDAVFALCSICYLPILMDIKLQAGKVLKPKIVLAEKILMFLTVKKEKRGKVNKIIIEICNHSSLQ